MTVTFEIKGLDDLQKQLSSLVNLAKEKQVTQTAARYALKEMFEDIRSNAPQAEQAYFRYKGKSTKILVQPGTLKKSIAYKRIKLEKSVGIGIYIKKAAFYWRFLEYGTPKMTAKPVLRQGFDFNKEMAVTRFKERYKKAIDQIIKKQGGR